MAKLGSWMQQEGLDDGAVAARLTELEPGGPVSHHTVGKWRRGERIPRGPNMTRIRRLTGNAVTANDFFATDEARAS
jgi:uncharacterized protein (DUF2126 family)